MPSLRSLKSRFPGSPAARWGKMFGLSAVIGVLTGLAASGLRYGLDFGIEHLIGRHARVHSTLRKAAAEGLAPSGDNLALLGADELPLIRLAAQFPRIVEGAAAAREPHRIAFFLYDLAAEFHAYYNLGNDDYSKRILLTEQPELTGARLFLAVQIGQVVKNGLNLLGVEAVEEL